MVRGAFSTRPLVSALINCIRVNLILWEDFKTSQMEQSVLPLLNGEGFLCEAHSGAKIVNGTVS